MKEINDSILPALVRLGLNQNNFGVSFTPINYSFAPNNPTPYNVPKGTGIRAIIDYTLPPETTHVICCDGSNKLPFRYIKDIFQELISDSSSLCVMANRKGDAAISDERLLVERFEIFSVTTYFEYKKELPDGQAGLWGYRLRGTRKGNEDKNIRLTADGYGIELDLLSEVISKQIPFTFIDVNIEKEDKRPTGYNYEDNLRKMKFITEKHAGLKEHVPSFFTDFEKQEKIRGLLENKDMGTYWERYKKDLLNIMENLGSGPVSTPVS